MLAGTIRAEFRHGASGACSIPFREQLIGYGPALCSAPDLLRAVQQAYRRGPDQPLHVPGCRVRWFSPTEACALLQTAGGLALGTAQMALSQVVFLPHLMPRIVC